MEVSALQRQDGSGAKALQDIEAALRGFDGNVSSTKPNILKTIARLCTYASHRLCVYFDMPAMLPWFHAFWC